MLSTELLRLSSELIPWLEARLSEIWWSDDPLLIDEREVLSGIRSSLTALLLELLVYHLTL